jgi:formylglycine-generating enzyme required for sulfatase activity
MQCSAGAASIAPVGTATLGAARWGQLDLAGDLSEWTLDWSNAYIVPSVDGANLSQPSYRVNRGGDFGDGTGLLLAASRGDQVVGARSGATGIRCARIPSSGAEAGSSVGTDGGASDGALPDDDGATLGDATNE